ncbi:Histone H4-like protein [Hapsidospora chrysogenum ATCC 11550]|uniref:Histone H4-like protein n=1 Tax=Hapsidospora chrysogenum (strain ATCC 11550 / CBS 779.69 / DSM 880 / IAM 14645 / JCM 23072 / IMI 49137) TaxID=857340 RepID=A0A086STI4_HAPC1|nr:Histone H4-like protein [Hapsidospora chrysogenum ATCC 11550]
MGMSNITRGGPGGTHRPGVGGKSIATAKRHRNSRLARRGGVKRISAGIYEETRSVLRKRLELVLKTCVAYTEYRKAKTVTVHDVIHCLRFLGTPIYGFDPDTHDARKSKTDRIHYTAAPAHI